MFLVGTVIVQVEPPVTTTQTPTIAETNANGRTTALPQQVETIVVKARPQTAKSRIDRVVYDVRTLPDSPASTAVDAIAQLPSVVVGANNRITMVGGAFVTVLVDGKAIPRPAALQIPTNQIVRIEVMSNPPAEFASSSQAVVNIITKKAAEGEKLSGSIASSIDTLENQVIAFSFSQGINPWKFNGFVRITSNEDPIITQSAGISGVGTNQELVSRVTRGESTASGVNGLVRVVRTFSNTDYLSWSSSYFSKDANYKTQSIETRTRSDSPSTVPVATVTQAPGDLQYHSLSFKSAKEDKYKFDFDVTLSQDISKLSYLSKRGALEFSNQEHKEEQNFEIKTEFERTFNVGRVLAFGMSYENKIFQLAFSDLGYGSAGVVQANVFNANQANLSSYASFQFKLGEFGIQPGIRLEDTVIDWTSGVGLSSGTANYQRLLPSLFVTRSLKKAGTLKASYSRGTTPGTLAEFNPFRREFGVDFATEGNPKLEPADRQTYELTHEIEWSGASLVTVAFYRDTKNEVTLSSRLIENNVVLATRVNLARSEITGIGSTLKGKFGRDLNYSLNWEVSAISFADPFLSTGKSRIDKFQSNGKLSLDYRLNSLNRLVISTTFQADNHRLGSVDEGYWENSIQYTRRLPKKVSLVVTATNIGVETERVIRSFGQDFSSRSLSSSPSRALKISLSKTF